MKLKIIKSILFSTMGLLSTSVVTPIMLSSCGKKQIPVDSVSLDVSELFLSPTDTDNSYKLTATILPEDATNKSVTWSTSDKFVATVDQNGNITAKNLGTTTITVTTKNGKKTATCEVTVTEKVIHVTSVGLDENWLFLNPNDSHKLIATVLPENATNKNVIWSSPKRSIATVDQSGFVTAKAPGTVDIAVTTEDGWYTTTCRVVVNDIHVEDITLDESELGLSEGETAQLKATILPEDATNKNVTWMSDNEKIVTVDQNGNVTANNQGFAVITVTTEDGNKTATCGINVIENEIPVRDVTLDKDKLELVEGETTKLIATVLPEDATNKEVTWSTSNASVATVDQNGNVIANNWGFATITVTTDDGNKTDTCEVNVIDNVIPVKSVKLDKDKLELAEGKNAQLIATVLPEDATNKNVTWISDNEKVATVDQNGNVKAVRKGYADIYVTTEDGRHTDFCWVVVTNNIPVKGVVLEDEAIRIYAGDSYKLTATVLPEDATNKKVIWKSSNESIATVDQNGNVTTMEDAATVGPTFAVITATTEDGGYVDSCTVWVNPPVVVGMNYGTWGNIKVKYKLFSNHECRLLTKFNGEDSENGYVEGAGVLRIPDHVVYNSEIYYVRRIPSEWSDGENNVNGLEFESNVSHLREICDYAFKGTNALDNYHHKVCIFPEGLEYIGTEAFYNVDRDNGLVMRGLDFPSTLNAINVRAFANAGLIGDEGNPATIMFRGNFNTANLCNEAFSPRTGKNVVYYVYAPVMEIAANIANHIKVVYEDDFEIGENCLIPKVLGW